MTRRWRDAGFSTWWRQFTNGWLVLAAIGAVILAVSTTIAAAPRVLETATSDDLRDTIRQATPEQRNIRFAAQREVGAGAPGNEFSNVEWIGDQLRDAHLPQSVLDAVADQQWLLDTPEFVVSSYPDQVVAQFPPTFRFRHQSDIDEHMRVREGALPSRRDPIFRIEGPDCPDDIDPEVADADAFEPEEGQRCSVVEYPVFETAITQATAADLAVEIGDRVVLRPSTTELGFFPAQIDLGRLRIVLEFSGIIELDPLEDEFWYGDNLLHRPRVTENADFELVFAAGLLGAEQYRPFRAAAPGVALDFSWRYVLDPERVEGTDSEQLVTDLEKIAPPDVEVVTLLPELLEDHIAQRRLTLQVWSMVGTVFAVAAAAAALTLARADAVRRRSVTALLEDRGASLVQLLTLDVRSAIALISVPAALGSALAWGALPDTANGAPLLAVGFFALGCAVALVGAGGRAPHDTRRRRMGVPVGFLVVVTVAVVVLLRRRETGVADAVGGGIDPTLMLAPVLIIASVAAAGSATIGPLARGGARLLARSRGSAWFLGLRRLGETVATTRGPLLAVVMAVGLSVLASVLATSIGGSQEAASAQEVGAEFRVESAVAGIPLADGVQTGLRDLDPDVTFGAVLPFQRFSAPSSGFVADVVALDSRLGSVRSDGVVDAELVGPWGATHLPRPGDELTLLAGAFAVPMEAVGRVERIAGIAPQRLTVVVDRTALADATSPRFAAADFALVGSDVRRDDLEALVDDTPAARLVSRTDRLDEITSDPLSTWTRRGLRLAALGGLALAGVATVATIMIGAPARRRDLGLLNVVGFDRRSAARVALAELAPVVTVALLSGVAGGVATGTLLAPNLTLEAFAGGVGRSEITFDWPALSLVTVSMAIVLALTIRAVVGSLRRLDHAMMLRRGET